MSGDESWACSCAGYSQWSGTSRSFCCFCSVSSSSLISGYLQSCTVTSWGGWGSFFLPSDSLINPTCMSLDSGRSLCRRTCKSQHERPRVTRRFNPEQPNYQRLRAASCQVFDLYVSHRSVYIIYASTILETSSLSLSVCQSGQWASHLGWPESSSSLQHRCAAFWSGGWICVQK